MSAAMERQVAGDVERRARTNKIEDPDKHEPCPCRECQSARSPFGGWRGSFMISDEERIAEARKSFVTELPRWGVPVWIYSVEWFEREVDDILGLTHAKHATKRMQRKSLLRGTTPVEVAPILST